MITVKIRRVFTLGRRDDIVYGEAWGASNVLFFVLGGG